MSTAIEKAPAAAVVEAVVMQGDLSKLSSEQRVAYYRAVCDSLGLNPLTRPFDYITLNNKLTLYPKRDATDQLRATRRISVQIVSREVVGEVYVVTARATTVDGRTDESIGAVGVAGLKGDALANAYMKAETKAKRRATLSIVGLGWMDESEAGSVPDAKPANVNPETGEVIDVPNTDDARKAAARNLKQVAGEAGLSVEQVNGFAKTMFGVESTRDLTAQQLGELAAEVSSHMESAQP